MLRYARKSAATHKWRVKNHLRWGLAAAPKLTRRFMSSPAARLSRLARFLADAAYGSAVDTMASTCDMATPIVSSSNSALTTAGRHRQTGRKTLFCKHHKDASSLATPRAMCCGARPGACAAPETSNPPSFPPVPASPARTSETLRWQRTSSSASSAAAARSGHPHPASAPSSTNASAAALAPRPTLTASSCACERRRLNLIQGSVVYKRYGVYNELDCHSIRVAPLSDAHRHEAISMNHLLSSAGAGADCRHPPLVCAAVASPPAHGSHKSIPAPLVALNCS